MCLLNRVFRPIASKCMPGLLLLSTLVNGSAGQILADEKPAPKLPAGV